MHMSSFIHLDLRSTAPLPTPTSPSFPCQVHLAVQRSGLALRFASEPLRRDREVVLSAVRQDRSALLVAGEELRKDKALKERW